VLGSTTFYDFTKSTSTTDTITFEAGERQTITNTLTLNGAESNLLSLRSTSAETAWEIDPQGTRTIAYLDVQDSNNVNASAIDASDGTNVDSDRNTNWSFGAEGGGSEQTARTQTRGGHFRFFGGSLIIR
jgi:hypothetical protein